MKDGGPAFPRPFTERSTNGEQVWEQDGMSLRDYFAAKAMQSYIITMKNIVTSDEKIVAWSYEMADAMIKAREAE